MQASPALPCRRISSAVEEAQAAPASSAQEAGRRVGAPVQAQPARGSGGRTCPEGRAPGSAPGAQWFPNENAKANRGPFESAPEPCERRTRCIYLGCNSLCQAHKMFTTCISARTRCETGYWVLADVSPGCFSLSLSPPLFPFSVYTHTLVSQTQCLYYIPLHDTQYVTASDCEKSCITSGGLSVAVCPSIR